MEYWTNNSKHYGESVVNHNLFSHRNKFKWMFSHSIGNCFGGHFTQRDGYTITFDNLLGRIKYTYGEWCNFLPMEHRTNHCKHYGESVVNDNLFRYRDQFQRLFKNR